MITRILHLLPHLPHLMQQEIAQVRHILLPLLHMRKMTRIIQRNPFHLWYVLEERPHRDILRFVLRSVH